MTQTGSLKLRHVWAYLDNRRTEFGRFSFSEEAIDLWVATEIVADLISLHDDAPFQSIGGGQFAVTLNGLCVDDRVFGDEYDAEHYRLVQGTSPLPFASDVASSTTYADCVVAMLCWSHDEAAANGCEYCARNDEILLKVLAYAVAPTA